MNVVLTVEKQKKNTSTTTASLSIQMPLAKALDQRHFANKSNSGVIQGSIVGPTLYAILLSHLFDLTPFHAFADDNLMKSKGQRSNL